MVTLAGMFSEMQTWFSIGKHLLDKADRSSINTKNNTKFKQLVKDWETGMYDEDPYTMLNELYSFL
jgi:hypothetical protein